MTYLALLNPEMGKKHQETGGLCNNLLG